jgi:hypothetical protein
MEFERALFRIHERMLTARGASKVISIVKYAASVLSK